MELLIVAHKGKKLHDLKSYTGCSSKTIEQWLAEGFAVKVTHNPFTTAVLEKKGRNFVLRFQGKVLTSRARKREAVAFATKQKLEYIDLTL